MRALRKTLIGVVVTTILAAVACSAERLISTGAFVAHVLVQPSTATIPVGGHVAAQATAVDSAGHPVQGAAVTWSTSSVNIATVGSSGDVAGVAPGSATITANSGGQSASLVVTVTVVSVSSLGLSPTSANLTAGQTAQLTATPRDGSGTALSGRVVTWATSNAAVATVSPSGSPTAPRAPTA